MFVCRVPGVLISGGCVCSWCQLPKTQPMREPRMLRSFDVGYVHKQRHTQPPWLSFDHYEMLLIAAVSNFVIFISIAQEEACAVFSPEECFQSGKAQGFQMTVGTRGVLQRTA